uniref:Uncharacterized protein n=1 Tax=Moniliophthora roreri TaxID=221103 RepID=A0A0W0FPQ0_MONRR
MMEKLWYLRKYEELYDTLYRGV